MDNKLSNIFEVKVEKDWANYFEQNNENSTTMNLLLLHPTIQNLLYRQTEANKINQQKLFEGIVRNLVNPNLVNKYDIKINYHNYAFEKKLYKEFENAAKILKSDLNNSNNFKLWVSVK